MTPSPPSPPFSAGARAASRRRAPSTRATRAASLRRRCCATCSATARSSRRSARPASAPRLASAPTPHRLWRSARPRAMASSRAPRLCTIGVTALWRPRWIGQRCSPPRSARTRARQHGQSALAWLAARCPRGHPPPGSPTHLPVLVPSLSAQWRSLASRLACRRGLRQRSGATPKSRIPLQTNPTPNPIPYPSPNPN